LFCSKTHFWNSKRTLNYATLGGFDKLVVIIGNEKSFGVGIQTFKPPGVA